MNKNHHNAARLRHIIFERFETMTAFAEKSKVDRSQLYPILRGEALPGLRKFVRLAGALELELATLAELLGVTDETGKPIEGIEP